MEASKVYYTDFRCPIEVSLPEKLRRLCIAAGIKDIDMDGKFVAIKMHFGELGNLAYLRPNYAKAVADLCKEQGGLPFLTDCNTLYPGSRKNALEHLSCAQLNGFWPMTTGCQVILQKVFMSRQKAPQLFSAGVLCGYDYFSTTSPFSSASTTRVPPDASVPSIRRSAAGSSTALRMVRRKSRAPKRPP